GLDEGGVAELRGGARFAEEAILRDGGIGLRLLDGDPAVESGIPRLPDDARPADADLLGEGIMPDHAIDAVGGRGLRSRTFEGFDLALLIQKIAELRLGHESRGEEQGAQGPLLGIAPLSLESLPKLGI